MVKSEGINSLFALIAFFCSYYKQVCIYFKVQVGIVGTEGTRNSKFATAYVHRGAHKELCFAHMTSYFDAEWKEGKGRQIIRLLKTHKLFT